MGLLFGVVSCKVESPPHRSTYLLMSTVYSDIEQWQRRCWASQNSACPLSEVPFRSRPQWAYPEELVVLDDHTLEIAGYRFRQFIAGNNYCIGAFPAPGNPLKMDRVWISSLGNGRRVYLKVGELPVTCRGIVPTKFEELK